MSKKSEKRLAHANMVWERDQLKAAIAAEQLNKAIAAVEQYKSELTEQQISDVYAQVEVQKKEIEKFLMKARDKYIKKLEELNGQLPVSLPKV